MFAELAAEVSPGTLQVDDQIMGLVLGHHCNAAHAGIDAVGQGKIDNPVLASEGRRGLGPVDGELLETGSATACQNDAEGVPGKAADVAARSLVRHPAFSGRVRSVGREHTFGQAL